MMQPHPEERAFARVSKGEAGRVSLLSQRPTAPSSWRLAGPDRTMLVTGFRG